METKNVKITSRDAKMADYINRILMGNDEARLAMMAWGVSEKIIIPQGMQFHVNGYKMEGYVQIVYNEASDLFDITFKPHKGKPKTIEDIPFTHLTKVIDEEVELVDNYNEKVESTYSPELVKLVRGMDAIYMEGAKTFEKPKAPEDDGTNE